MPYKNPHPLYYVWAKLRYRARKSGAHVCPQWESFPVFLADVGERPKNGMLLTLKDESLGYVPGNCVWVDEANKVKIKTGYRPAVSHYLYWTWRGMISRCYEPTNLHYKNYGGRGITICEKWRHDFHAFASDMGERPSGMSIDRIDNNGIYEPSNCRWATKKQQQSNQRVNRLIAFGGETQTITEWARRIGVKPDTIAARIVAGYPLETALTKKRLPRQLDGLKLGGKANGEKKRAITHCPKGHAYDETNTDISKEGWRRCRECHRTAAREARRAKNP